MPGGTVFQETAVLPDVAILCAVRCRAPREITRHVAALLPIAHVERYNPVVSGASATYVKPAAVPLKRSGLMEDARTKT